MGVSKKKVMIFGVLRSSKSLLYIVSFFLAKHRVTSEYLVAKIVEIAENEPSKMLLMLVRSDILGSVGASS